MTNISGEEKKIELIKRLRKEKKAYKAPSRWINRDRIDAVEFQRIGYQLGMKDAEKLSYEDFQYLLSLEFTLSDTTRDLHIIYEINDEFVKTRMSDLSSVGIDFTDPEDYYAYYIGWTKGALQFWKEIKDLLFQDFEPLTSSQNIQNEYLHMEDDRAKDLQNEIKYPVFPEEESDIDNIPF